MKVQLVHPPDDSTYSGYRSDHLVSVPTGLELIAKATEQRVPGSEIEIIDGTDCELGGIVRSLDADIVGVSDWYSCRANTLSILRHAKLKGTKTVIGGPNTTHLAERVLENHAFVDYAVVGDGEEAFSMLVAGEDEEDIPGLVYRRHGQVIRNKRRDLPLDRIFDLEHLDNSAYNRSNPLPLSSIRGCAKAERHKRCSFCSIDHRLRVMRPEKFWEQVRTLNERYGFYYFWETGDSFLIGKYPQMLLEARPSDLQDVELKIYASQEQVSSDVAKTLKQLNVRSVFLGFEAADAEVLKRANSRNSRELADRALDLFLGVGIQEVIVPFMFSLPGETRGSLERSFQYAKYIRGRYPNVRLFVSRTVPVAGSQLFEDLREHPGVRREYNGDLAKDDSFDYGQLSRLMIKYFTSVSNGAVCDYYLKARKLDPRCAGFGETDETLNTL